MPFRSLKAPWGKVNTLRAPEMMVTIGGLSSPSASPFLSEEIDHQAELTFPSFPIIYTC